MAVDFIKKAVRKASTGKSIFADYEMMGGVWEDPETWNLSRAPINMRDDGYDDGRGFVELYGYEFDEGSELRETSVTLVICTTKEAHADYSWSVPPSHIEINWADELNERDSKQLRVREDEIAILSDMELKSFSVKVVSRSQVVISAVYQYHNEIL